MKRFSVLLILVGVGLAVCCSPESPRYRIWFKEPAANWEATLPLGNGHIGMMPDGKITKETIVLNDITLWSGGFQDADNPEAAKYLPEIRNLLFEGKNDKAQELIFKTFVCKGAGSGHGKGSRVPYGSYEILGNLHLDFKTDTTAVPENYERSLNIDDAVAHTDFTLNGVRYRREYFTSFNGDVGVIRLSSGQKGKVSFTIRLDRPEKYETSAEGDILKMEGQLENGTDGKGMQYQVLATVRSREGSVSSIGKTIEVTGASEAVIYLSAGTNYKNPLFRMDTREKLISASTIKYERLKKAHQLHYQSYFNRVELNLPVNPEREKLTTPERLIAFAENPDDNGLVNLYFQYGRYLLISSSCAQILPPNLQGLWANTIQTPWNGDYHLNINVQMNHWPAEVTNLPEMHKPLVELTRNLVAPGTRTAKCFYGAEGWVSHMMTNVWGFTAPGEHPSWGATNTGGAWLCSHLWDHFDFNRDTSYLTDIYPVLKGSALFFLDMLVRDPKSGWLVTAPSTSPENAFLMPVTGKPVNICMGPTIDNQLIRELFGNTVKGAGILGIDTAFSRQLTSACEQLPPTRIGSDGRLLEWLEEYEEQDPHHRHISHLYGLYPGNQITPELTPELAEAARRSLETRGDGGTGWSRAWKINFWARLYNGNHAFTLLKNLLEPVFDTQFNYSDKGGTYPNLFCAHPPFQIDGNWGGCAGIAEMLLQSHDGFIHIIPAIPDQFRDGAFNGLRVRGGGTVAAKWKEKKLERVSLKADQTGDFKIKIPEYVKNLLVTINGKKAVFLKTGSFLTVNLHKNDQMELKYF